MAPVPWVSRRYRTTAEISARSSAPTSFAGGRTVPAANIPFRSSVARRRPTWLPSDTAYAPQGPANESSATMQRETGMTRMVFARVTP